MMDNMQSSDIDKMAKALAKVQAEVPRATKGTKGARGKYADLTSVLEAILPVLSKNGIAVYQAGTQIESYPYLATTLIHESGQWLRGWVRIEQNKPNDPQALGAGITYARRYGLAAMCGLGQEDDDGEAQAEASRGQRSAQRSPQQRTPQQASPEQPAEAATPAQEKLSKALTKAEAARLHKSLGGMKLKEYQQALLIAALFDGLMVDSFTDLTRRQGQVIHGAASAISDQRKHPSDYGIDDAMWETDPEQLEQDAVAEANSASI